jgi:hypothetical protein
MSGLMNIWNHAAGGENRALPAFPPSPALPHQGGGSRQDAAIIVPLPPVGRGQGWGDADVPSAPESDNKKLPAEAGA